MPCSVAFVVATLEKEDGLRMSVEIEFLSALPFKWNIA